MEVYIKKTIYGIQLNNYNEGIYKRLAAYGLCKCASPGDQVLNFFMLSNCNLT